MVSNSSMIRLVHPHTYPSSGLCIMHIHRINIHWNYCCKCMYELYWLYLASWHKIMGEEVASYLRSCIVIELHQVVNRYSKSKSWVRGSKENWTKWLLQAMVPFSACPSDKRNLHITLLNRMFDYVQFYACLMICSALLTSYMYTYSLLQAL